jgi:hypothetical protein
MVCIRCKMWVRTVGGMGGDLKIKTLLQNQSRPTFARDRGSLDDGRSHESRNLDKESHSLGPIFGRELAEKSTA